MLNLKKLLTKSLEMLAANDLNRIQRDSLTGTIDSIPANSYADITLDRPSGTFLAATISISGTSICVPWLQNVLTSTITVRVRNISTTNAAAHVGVSVYFLRKT